MAEKRGVVLVVAAALIDAAGRVLMQRRRLDRAHGGLWEFPGGKVEAGEGPEAALRREIAEELGLELAAATLEPVSFAAKPGLPQLILLYRCSDWKGLPQCLDGEDIGWFALDALADLAMPPLDYPLARALNRQDKTPPVGK